MTGPRWALAVLVIVSLAPGATTVPTRDPAAASVADVCRGGAAPAAEVDPFSITLVPTPHANGASGTVRLRFAQSPFGLALTPDGHHLYDLMLAVEGVEPEPGAALVAWAATPSLDQVRKLGVVDGDGTLASRVAYNKFLVFVTSEVSADVERWSGPILLRGISRSGRMHTMAGHGPFSGQPC